MRAISWATNAVIACTVLFQLLQFWALWGQAVRQANDQFALTMEQVCMDPEKAMRYQNHLDCRGAEQGSRRSPLSIAFQDWITTRFLYQLLTLGDWTSKASALLLAVYLLHRVTRRAPAPATTLARIDGGDYGYQQPPPPLENGSWAGSGGDHRSFLPWPGRRRRPRARLTLLPSSAGSHDEESDT